MFRNLYAKTRKVKDSEKYIFERTKACSGLLHQPSRLSRVKTQKAPARGVQGESMPDQVFCPDPSIS